MTTFGAIVERIAAEQSVPAELLHSVIQVESNYNPGAVSPKGAQGLMQLMPDTARRFGVPNSFDPVENIQGGAKYLKYLLELYKGDYPRALAAYNAGEKAVAKYGGIPPYVETRNYVTQVQSRVDARRKIDAAKPAAARPEAPKLVETAQRRRPRRNAPRHIQEIVAADGSVTIRNAIGFMKRITACVTMASRIAGLGAIGVALATIAGIAQTAHPGTHNVSAVRHWSTAGTTRIAIEVSGEFEYRSDRLHNPERVYYDILNARPRFDGKRLYTEDLDDPFVKRIRVAETTPGVTRIVFDLAGDTDVSASILSSPDRLIVELRHACANVQSGSATRHVRAVRTRLAPAAIRRADRSPGADLQRSNRRSKPAQLRSRSKIPTV